MEIKIGNVIRQLRKANEISQETLAEKMNVTVQAVSKWENGLSIPDVSLIPEIAEHFGVTTDYLFFGEDKKSSDPGIPNDGNLYIVQAMNGKILGCEQWQSEKIIRLELTPEYSDKISLSIWGSAEIKGNVSGGVSSEGNVFCGNVSGGIRCSGTANCGNISGGVVCDSNINCGNTSGGITAGGNISCGNISGNISSDGNIHCGDIIDSDTIKCSKLHVKGNVTCQTVYGKIIREE